MESSFVIWGSAGHAKVLAELIVSQGSRVVALFDNDPAVLSCLDKVPIYHGEAGLAEWVQEHGSLQDVFAAVAIGGARGRDRQLLATRFEAVGVAVPTLIHSSAFVSDSARYGDGCHFLAQSMVGVDVVLGRDCIVNSAASIDHECLIGDGVHVAPGAILCGCVVVGRNSMIGAGACVLPRVHIGSNVVVGAGAVVTRHVPDNVVVLGNPARVLRNNK